MRRVLHQFPVFFWESAANRPTVAALLSLDGLLLLLEKRFFLAARTITETSRFFDKSVYTGLGYSQENKEMKVVMGDILTPDYSKGPEKNKSRAREAG